MSPMLRRFLVALQFLTILPVRLDPPPDRQEFCASMTLYPLVGALIGVVSALAGAIAGSGWGPVGGAFATVAALAVVSGGLHLDGVADAADGLFSWRSRERMLEIMRDSRLGTMGALALLGLLAFKVILLARLPLTSQPGAVVAAAAAARCGSLWMARLFHYARTGDQEASAASGVVGRVGWPQVIKATILAYLLCAILGRPGAVVQAIVVAIVVGRWITSRIGGITGDGVGAGIELAETAMLAVAAWHV